MSPEEKEVIEEVEKIEKEEVVEEESKKDSESLEDGEKDDTDSDTDSEDDADDGYEAEVLGQYGLKHKSVKELADTYKKDSEELNRLRKEAEFNKLFLQKDAGKQEEQIAPFGIAPQRQEQQKQLGAFPERPANSLVDQLTQSGRIKRDDEPQFRSMATLIDESLSPVLAQQQEWQYQATAVINKLLKNLRDMTYGSFNHPQKGNVQRDMLDKLMGAQGFDSYDDAMNFYIMKTNPSLLASIAEKAREEGKKDGSKQLRRLRANRRGSPAPTLSLNKYLDRDGNINREKLVADFKGDESKAAEFIDKYTR